MVSTEAVLATGVVVLVAGMVQYAAGFGFALLATPLLSLPLGTHDAVLISVGLGLVGSITMTWSGRRVVDGPVLLGVLLWAPPGLLLGLALYVLVDDNTLQLFVAVAVIVAVISLLAGWRIREASRTATAVTGLLAGALTTTTGTNGPPIVTLLTAKETNADAFRATTSAVFLALDAVAVPLHVIGTRRSSTDSDLGWWTVLVCAPTLFLGAWLGTRSRGLLTDTGFRGLVLVLLSCSAAVAAGAALLG
jgi:uncharacterized membrane protein YfcA